MRRILSDCCYLSVFCKMCAYFVLEKHIASEVVAMFSGKPRSGTKKPQPHDAEWRTQYLVIPELVDKGGSVALSAYVGSPSWFTNEIDPRTNRPFVWFPPAHFYTDRNGDFCPQKLSALAT